MYSGILMRSDLSSLLVAMSNVHLASSNIKTRTQIIRYQTSVDLVDDGEGLGDVPRDALVFCAPVSLLHPGTQQSIPQGVGAKSPIVAQVAEQVPRAALQAMTAAGAAAAATTVPKVNPAAA